MWGCDSQYRHHHHHQSGIHFLPLLFLFGLLFWGGFHGFFWLIALLFIMPMLRSWAYSHHESGSDVIVIKKEKRKNDFIEKEKNQPDYFRTKDGEWLEIID